MTSPPYAQQRKRQYGGIAPAEYPEWTVAWMSAAAKLLTQRASILINIREHVSNGEMSDYVLRSRLALRDAGFIECDEEIWDKPDAPPLGDPKRPRRSWERILWFSLSRRPYCDPRANGKMSNRIGYPADVVGKATRGCVAGFSDGFRSGIARHRDLVTIRCGSNERGVNHPAKYPVELAAWLIRGWSPPGSTVLDLFNGSGTTGVAAVENERMFVGVEVREDYCEIARTRIEKALQRKG